MQKELFGMEKEEVLKWSTEAKGRWAVDAPPTLQRVQKGSAACSRGDRKGQLGSWGSRQIRGCPCSQQQQPVRGRARGSCRNSCSTRPCSFRLRPRSERGAYGWSGARSGARDAS